MSDHSRVDDFLKQQVSLKPQPTEYKKARLFMAEKTMKNKDYADTLLLNMIDKYGIHVMYIVIIIELIHYMW